VTGSTNFPTAFPRQASNAGSFDAFVAKLGLPAIAINNVSVTEGNSGTLNATFTVSLFDASAQTVSVQYATANGTATGGAACISGVDYISTSGTLTFTANQISKTISVPVCGDTLDEPNETFLVNLSLHR
jgi:hypothetical protein